MSGVGIHTVMLYISNVNSIQQFKLLFFLSIIERITSGYFHHVKTFSNVKMNDATIVMSIFNKGHLIREIVTALFLHTTNEVKEYIFVIDGCTDDSESVLRECISAHNMTDITRIFHANNVFEIRSNNIGIREVKTPYVIIVQDDMKIMEPRWNERLMIPIKLYDDIWAVTARTTCSLSTTGEWYNIREGPVGHRYSMFDAPRDKIYIGQVVNRGPLLMDMEVLKKIKYLDESLPGIIGCDDVDACLKVYKEYGLRCCSCWIGYYSPLEWGATRSSHASSLFCNAQEALNKREVIRRYRTIIEDWSCDEVRTIT